MLIAISDFLVILDILEELSCCFAVLLRVMIAANQHLVACKRSKVERPVGFLVPDKITENIDRIITGDNAVPVRYNP